MSLHGRCCLVALMASLATAVGVVLGGLSDHRIPKFINKETDKAILDDLLDGKRYDRRSRPDNHTVVSASIQLFSVASPDESSLNYEVEFLLHLKWKDWRLQFNDAGRHRYLKALTHANGLWIPDLYFIKHGELKQPLVNMSLKVLSDGTVIHITRRSMVINCQGNLQIFPFDNPKCPFAFESNTMNGKCCKLRYSLQDGPSQTNVSDVSHETSEMELQWDESEPPLISANSWQYHNAYLVKNDTGTCDLYHTWRGMVLVTSSFISFWLDINVVPARVMIGVTTMLNFCTTTNNFRSKLPVVSNLTAMNLWDGVCMFFIYASLLEFVIGNYIHRKFPHLSRPTTELQRKPSSCMSRRSHYLSGDSMPMQTMQSNAAGPIPSESKSEVSSGGDQPQTEVQSPEQPGAEDLKTPENKQEVAAPARQPKSPVIPLPMATAECVVTLRRQVKSLDNIAKLVFPVIFGIFISCFFLTYAVIKPRQSENWDLVGVD